MSEVASSERGAGSETRLAFFRCLSRETHAQVHKVLVRVADGLAGSADDHARQSSTEQEVHKRDEVFTLLGRRIVRVELPWDGCSVGDRD